MFVAGYQVLGWYDYKAEEEQATEEKARSVPGVIANQPIAVRVNPADFAMPLMPDADENPVFGGSH